MYKDTEQTGLSVDFIKNYEILEKIYSEILNKKLVKKFNNNKLKMSDFLDLIDKASLNGNKRINKIQQFVMAKLANLLSPQYEDDFTELMEILYMTNKLDQLEDYSMRVISTDDNLKLSMYLKKGKAFSEPKGNRVKKITQENIKNYDEIFGFTYELDDNFKKTIKDFDELMSNVFAKNPNIRVQILDRVIIINDGKKDSYYVIDKTLIPAEVEEEVSVKFAKQSKKTEKTSEITKALIPTKHGIIDRILNSFRKKKNNTQPSTNLQPTFDVISYKNKRKAWINQDIKQDIHIFADKNENDISGIKNEENRADEYRG